MSCGRLLQFDVAEQRQADLKLLEAPDIGTGVGGKPKVLVPKAVDADEEGDDDDEESESSDDEVIYAMRAHSSGHSSFHVDCQSLMLGQSSSPYGTCHVPCQ